MYVKAPFWRFELWPISLTPYKYLYW